MLTDRFGGRHSSSNRDALAAFEDAVLGIAAHRPTVAVALEQALAADPGFTAAHALKGLAAVILARQELLGPARSALADAKIALAAHGRGTASERALVRALDAAVQGRIAAAADLVDRHIEATPQDFVAIKLSHAFRFMLGDASGMLATTSGALPAWQAAMPGYGFLLGCHAFGLEECGQLRAAELAGRTALQHEPCDAWGLHAVSHVHEMEGRTEQGIAWLEHTRAVWSRCNNFSFHLAWHLALFHLEQGQHDRALALYDTDVRPRPTDDCRDVANAVSLLWRLQQEGVGVGQRWEELRQIARRRRRDTTLLFAALHYLMALVAAGDVVAARELAGEIGRRASSGTGDQARVAAQVGCGLASAILGLAHRSSARIAFGHLARDTPQLGGSHAQRDVFVRTLAMIAAEHGDRAAVEQIVGRRARLKREDRFASLVRSRLDAAVALPRAS
jgi:tetratricopeptide (TPR) repeat protein